MNRITNVLTGLSLAVLFLVASAHAQVEQRTVANIPFEFTVVGRSFPAGQYEFLRSGDGVVLVRDGNGHGLFIRTIAEAQESGIPGKSALTFATVDGRPVLIQIWNENAGVGNEFPYEPVSVQATQPPTLTEQ